KHILRERVGVRASRCGTVASGRLRPGLVARDAEFRRQASKDCSLQRASLLAVPMRWVAVGRIANPSYLTGAACPPLSRARIWKGRMKTDRIFGQPSTFRIIGTCGTDRESIPRRSSRLARRGCRLLNSTAAAIRDGRCSTQPGKSAARSRTVWFPRESPATPCRALAGDSRKTVANGGPPGRAGRRTRAGREGTASRVDGQLVEF